MAWARNRYGVFPESGFAGDARYPESFVYAGEDRATVGCNQTGHEVSSKQKFYTKLSNSRFYSQTWLLPSFSDAVE